MSYIITDIDGTLTTSGDTPRTDYIDYLRSEAEGGEEVIVVSARPVSRLDETRAWLNENNVPHSQLHLNDFSETPGPNVALEFKRYKYELLIKEYGIDAIDKVVDNDADVRAMATELGLEAYTPQELVAGAEDTNSEDRAAVSVPEYVAAAARAGLKAYEDGRGGDGLVPQTIDEARDLANGRTTDEKVKRMAAWIRRHRGDWEGVPQNSDPSNKDYPSPGAVAALLWGVNPADTNSTDRVLRWADRIVASMSQEENAMAREHEIRSLPLDSFSVSDDGEQKTFVGYAALYGKPSAGLPFTEVIAPGAFKRTLARVAKSERVVKFLHGHDESRMLASTASGRLTLSEDEQGLRVEAKLDPADPDAAAVISKLTHEAKAMGMSFGFTVPKGGDVWDGEQRTLREVNLFEVSILSGHAPAYPATLGLSAVRKVAENKLGVDADLLMSTIESVKAGKDLSTDEIQVIDAVRSALAPKPVAIDPSVAAARLMLAKLESDNV